MGSNGALPMNPMQYMIRQTRRTYPTGEEVVTPPIVEEEENDDDSSADPLATGANIVDAVVVVARGHFRSPNAHRQQNVVGN